MRYIQDPVTLELVPASQYRAPSNKVHDIQGDIEPFISPIDKSIISSRSDLREHNRRHNVTNASDYSPEFIAARQRQREAAFKPSRERKQALYDAWVAKERQQS
jgi:hypothetical protein